ncbi:MAG: hypothetical protein E7353_05065 [Clostridiales bacterium]|nr:hypothetical protein [Clostridiales bacterium]
MKKRAKIGISIGAVLLVAVVVLVLVFSLVNTKPLENLADFRKAIVYEDANANGYHIAKDLPGQQGKNYDKLKKLLKENSYSLMQSIFSGRTDTDNKTYYENGEVVKFTQTELTGEGKGLYEKYDQTLPKLRLEFSEVKEAKIGSKSYTFDTVEMLVANTYGEIREVTCIAWDSTEFENQNEETEFAGFAVFKISANTTSLYNFMIGLNA